MPLTSPPATLVRVSRPVPEVALVTLDRQEARNAVNPDLAADLAAAIAALEDDPAIRAVILTGAGDKAFCAGADLRAVAEGRLEALFSAGGFAGFTHASRRKPWIAAINGDALAGGLELALACDVRITVEEARFGLPEPRRGLIASGGGAYRLARAMPQALALEMIVTGEPISAEVALRHGLVSRITPRHELIPTAMSIAAAIVANAPLAVEESLALARRAYDCPDRELEAQGHAVQRVLMATEDFYEGARAFVEKRPPNWQGR